MIHQMFNAISVRALVVMILFWFSAPAMAVSLNVADFGAVGDGKTLNTAAIQSAIDACNKKGGGVVRLGVGEFLSGTLNLKDNVTLRLEAGAVLLGSTNIADYVAVDEFKDGLCLVAAVSARHVGIEGAGKIDGQGKALVAKLRAAGKTARPFLIRWIKCQEVDVSDVRLEQSAMWVMHVYQCKDVRVDSVAIVSHATSNNDGIDIDSSDTVRINNCDIDTGDDSICMKTTSPAACHDITVSNCKLKSNCGAIKFGTESVGDLDGVHISDCHIVRADLAGIKLFSVDGAHVRNVDISNITMDDGKVPIFLRLGSRLKTWHTGDEKRDVGSFENVRIEKFHGKGESPGILISGVPGHDVEGVTLNDVDLDLTGNGTSADSAVVLPENPRGYPEIRMFGPRFPSFGIFARHVRGLTVSKLKISVESPDQRVAAIFDDAHEIKCSTWNIAGDSMAGEPAAVGRYIHPLNGSSVTMDGRTVEPIP